MASGTIVGVDDGAKENKRFVESNVYRRKSYKGPKNKPNSLTPVVLNAVPTTATAHSDDVNNNSEIFKDDNVVDIEKNENKELGQEQAQTVLTEDGNSAKLQGNLRPEAVSDDSSTLNHRQSEPANLNGQLDEHLSTHHQLDERLSTHHQLDEPLSTHNQQDEPLSSNQLEEAAPSTRELPSGNGVVMPGSGNRMKIDVSSRSKEEIIELKRKLENELGMVRSLVRRVEVKLGQIGEYGGLNSLVSGGIDNGIARRHVQSEVRSVVSREPMRPLHQLNLSALENSHGASGSVEKEKRTPKANQLYRNSEFLLAKDKFPPSESNKKSKLNGKKHGGGEMGHGFGMGLKFFKCCNSLLDKLMKHRHGWVFNAPVDAEGLGLHDYFTIISHPMDLGTVKTRLNNNWYKTPKEFAEDVRLTFSNAMTYNPPGQDVHIMADVLSKIFEERWIIIESDYNREVRYAFDYGNAPPASSPMFRKAAGFHPPPLDMRRILDRSGSMTQTPKSVRFTPSSRTPALKKPKAKDLFKRDMTYDEKQKLSSNLQSLPLEKLDSIVQIMKKRNSAVSQHDDEVEVDIDSLDAETLWELDRFVTNYKKSLSKKKRKAEIAIQRAETAKQARQMASDMVEVPKENLADERNVSPLLPVPGDKPLDNGNRSSSSSSSSSDSGSSSTDSDSESSSASGSVAGSQGT